MFPSEPIVNIVSEIGFFCPLYRQLKQIIFAEMLKLTDGDGGIVEIEEEDEPEGIWVKSNDYCHYSIQQYCSCW